LVTGIAALHTTVLYRRNAAAIPVTKNAPIFFPDC
jgi:hypothetical protein